MLKMIGLLKRKPGMTPEAFRDYYESKHRLIGEKHLRGHACRYTRRYLTPVTQPDAADGANEEFDVLVEIWYPDSTSCQASLARLAQPEIAAEIAEDEEQLFDRPRNRFFMVEESESEV